MLVVLDGGLHLTDEIRASRDDTIVVHSWMTRVVMHLDMIHMTGFFDSWDLPDIAAVSEHIWEFSNSSRVTLKVHSVHLIVSDQCLKEAHIGKGEFFAAEELFRCQMLVKLVHILGVIGDSVIVGTL